MLKTIMGVIITVAFLGVSTQAFAARNAEHCVIPQIYPVPENCFPAPTPPTSSYEPPASDSSDAWAPISKIKPRILSPVNLTSDPSNTVRPVPPFINNVDAGLDPVIKFESRTEVKPTDTYIKQKFTSFLEFWRAIWR